MARKPDNDIAYLTRSQQVWLLSPRFSPSLIANMTDSKLPALHGTPFAPRSLVPVAVGHATVNLYPVIDPSMPVEERAHAYQVKKTALASAPVNLRVQLNALGQQLNLVATVDGVRDDWLRFFHNSWCDF